MIKLTDATNHSAVKTSYTIGNTFRNVSHFSFLISWWGEFDLIFLELKLIFIIFLEKIAFSSSNNKVTSEPNGATSFFFFSFVENEYAPSISNVKTINKNKISNFSRL